MPVKVAVSIRVPLGGETPSVVLRNVDNVTDEMGPFTMLESRPLVTLIVPGGAVRPVSVNQRMGVPAAVAIYVKGVGVELARGLRRAAMIWGIDRSVRGGPGAAHTEAMFAAPSECRPPLVHAALGCRAEPQLCMSDDA
jgi:hypothetical protein